MHSSTSGSSVLRAINGAVFEIENEMQSQAACRKEEQPKPEEPVDREYDRLKKARFCTLLSCAATRCDSQVVMTNLWA